jgi:hypothetical protein
MGYDFAVGAEPLPFSTAFTPSVAHPASNQSLCPELKLPERENYLSSGFRVESEAVDINLHSPIRFDGVLVNNTVTDLSLIRSLLSI